MSITNFPMSMADVEALGAFADPDSKITDAQINRLIAKSKQAREWLAKLHAPCVPVTQPKQPA